MLSVGNIWLLPELAQHGLFRRLSIPGYLFASRRDAQAKEETPGLVLDLRRSVSDKAEQSRH
jgi:hypothetical protein